MTAAIIRDVQSITAQLWRKNSRSSLIKKNASPWKGFQSGNIRLSNVRSEAYQRTKKYLKNGSFGSSIEESGHDNAAVNHSQSFPTESDQGFQGKRFPWVHSTCFRVISAIQEGSQGSKKR